MNPMRRMFERLAYLLWLGGAGVSFGFVGLSPWSTWPEPGAMFLGGGLGGLFAAWLLHTVGESHWHFAEHARVLDQAPLNEFTHSTPEYQERVENLRRVFYRWEALDALRAEGKADVWAVQALRQEALTLLQQDPRLSAEFDRDLSRHPELRHR